MARTTLLNVHRLIEDAKKGTNNIDVAASFLADLNRCISLMDKEEHSGKPSPTYKPSSLQCIRNMYYQVTEANPDEEETSPDLVGICQSGSDRHERIQYAVSKMKDFGMDCEYIDVETFVKQRGLTDLQVVGKQGFETKLVHKKYNLRFLCDGIIKYQGKYYILEIKTEHSYKWVDRNGVDPKHYNQATAYSLCFKLDDVMFLYESRDVCSKKPYLHHVTQSMRSDLIEKIQRCDEYKEKHIPPPRPLNLPKKICAYCSYKSQCKRDGV